MCTFETIWKIAIQSRRKGDPRIVMIWEEYRIICQLNITKFFLVSELIQKQVKKFIYTALLQPVQIQAWFQEVLFFPVGGISVVMRKQAIYGQLLYSDMF